MSVTAKLNTRSLDYKVGQKSTLYNSFGLQNHTPRIFQNTRCSWFFDTKLITLLFIFDYQRLIYYIAYNLHLAQLSVAQKPTVPSGLVAQLVENRWSKFGDEGFESYRGKRNFFTQGKTTFPCQIVSGKLMGFLSALKSWHLRIDCLISI